MVYVSCQVELRSPPRREKRQAVLLLQSQLFHDA